MDCSFCVSLLSQYIHHMRLTLSECHEEVAKNTQEKKTWQDRQRGSIREVSNTLFIICEIIYIYI